MLASILVTVSYYFVRPNVILLSTVGLAKVTHKDLIQNCLILGLPIEIELQFIWAYLSKVRQDYHY